jgi:hypothetical protein
LAASIDVARLVNQSGAVPSVVRVQQDSDKFAELYPLWTLKVDAEGASGCSRLGSTLCGPRMCFRILSPKHAARVFLAGRSVVRLLFVSWCLCFVDCAILWT